MEKSMKHCCSAICLVDWFHKYCTSPKYLQASIECLSETNAGSNQSWITVLIYGLNIKPVSKYRQVKKDFKVNNARAIFWWSTELMLWSTFGKLGNWAMLYIEQFQFNIICECGKNNNVILKFKTTQVNTGAVGFFRTQYSSDMLDALLPAIKDGSLPPRDRLGLQNDLFALVSWK